MEQNVERGFLLLIVIIITMILILLILHLIGIFDKKNQQQQYVPHDAMLSLRQEVQEWMLKTSNILFLTTEKEQRFSLLPHIAYPITPQPEILHENLEPLNVFTMDDLTGDIVSTENNHGVRVRVSGFIELKLDHEDDYNYEDIIVQLNISENEKQLYTVHTNERTVLTFSPHILVLNQQKTICFTLTIQNTNDLNPGTIIVFRSQWFVHDL
jgi:hypothetical protein